MSLKRNLIVWIWMLAASSALAQNSSTQANMPLRFINKIEIFAGPGLSFNRGNKFIENYKDANIENKRLLKVGYTAGVGIYHTLSKRIDLNLRFQFEKKGTMSELDHPLNPVNNDSRQLISTSYSYNYLTLSLAPIAYIDKEKRFALSVGGYLGKIGKTSGIITYSDPASPLAVNNFIGRIWASYNPDGGINGSTFIPGLQSFEKYDYGIVIGFYHNISVSANQNISIRLIANYGIQDINKKSIIESLPEKNHSLSLILGYILNRNTKI